MWFLHNKAFTLPQLIADPKGTGAYRTVDGAEGFFDPYDKSPRLATLPKPPLPSSTAPTWTRAESKRGWKSTFHQTLRRSDSDVDDGDSRRVDIASLHSSGTATPNGGKHVWAGQGSGRAENWSTAEGLEAMTPSERKIASREAYKALNGRKARNKRKMAGEYGTRDKGGAGGFDDDDSRFTAPF